jgi:hypothetical protein
MQVANGWRFLRGDGGSPETFTLVPHTQAARPGAPTSPDLDGTHLQSSGRETAPGLPAFGDFTARTLYKPNDPVHNAMRAEAPSAALRNYRLMDPTETFGFQYALRIATFNMAGIEVDDVLQNEITFKQAGQPTLVGSA